MVLREGMVEPLVSLFHAWLACCLVHLDEKILHVLVGEERFGWDDIAAVAWGPFQIVGRDESFRVLLRFCNSSRAYSVWHTFLRRHSDVSVCNEIDQV